MNSSSLRPESHIAQQSRRDKLRIQSSSSSSFQIPDNFESLNPDLVQIRNTDAFYDTVFPSQMLAFGQDSSSSSSVANMSNPVIPKISSNDNWRSVDSSHQNFDWTMNNFASGTSQSVGKEISVLSNNARVSNLKPHYTNNVYGHHDIECLNEIPKHFSYNHINSSLQDVVTPTSLYLDNSHQWSNELGLITRKHEEMTNSDPNTQGLSLSLSSNPPYRGNIIAQLGDRYESEYLQSKLVKSDYSSPKSLSTKMANEMIGTSNYAVRNAGPLGPFTGYATILKNSKFLKPAQDMLDEFCNSTGVKHIPARICGELSTSLGNSNECGIISSSATFYGSNGAVGDAGMVSNSGEYQQEKAKLLYLQEEVCRKHKQYQLQMQMVASSFEAVAGLSAATPYVSLSLKTVSRNFRDLKHAISDQLKRITRALGEDSVTPNVGGSSSRGDPSTSKMRHMDQSLQRVKSGGPNSNFFEPQQHVWRPQRGLPERAVAILKAWLYEHFLHPYPNDTDKHMLANQTGLSRNQVSNWFINARVRVWKPMVEEIHMLETKSLAETNRNCGNNEGKSAECSSQPNYGQTLNNVGSCSTMNKQVECSGSGTQINNEQWNQEKRSRIEYEVPSSMDGSIMNFVPYQRGGIDIGAVGAVSLTLGLRHAEESVQLQPHEDQIRRQFGGQMIHDFVG